MTRDADGHDAFVDWLSAGDIYDPEFVRPARVDYSRLAEFRDGWLGMNSQPDPRDEPYAEEQA